MADPQGPSTPSKFSQVSFGKSSIREFEKEDPPNRCNPMSPGPENPRKETRKRKRRKLPSMDNPSGDNPSGDNQNGCLPPNHKIAKGKARPIQLATMTPEQIAAERKKTLERNRRAAAECRKRRKAELKQLEATVAAAEAKDAMQRKTIKELHSTIDRLQAKLGIHHKAGSDLSQKERHERAIALRTELEDPSADFEGAFCGADLTGASGYSPIAFPKAKVTVVKGEFPELGELAGFLPHADKPVEGPEVDPILAKVSLTLRQVNGKLAERGFITETVPRAYDPSYIQSVVRTVRLDPVLAHRPWDWWTRGKNSGSRILRKRPSHVEPTVFLPSGKDK